MLFQPAFIRFFSKTTKLQKFYPVKKDQQILQVFPKQHPTKIDSNSHDIITMEKPPVYITEAKAVPFELYLPKSTEFESPEHSRALEVALIGAPNAGKSSLFNRFIGGNISAVSNKSNTTDEAIQGVYTNIENRTQLIFYDTPGITQLFKSSKHFVTRAWETLDTCDKALFVVDSVKRVDDAIKEALRRLKRMKLGETYREKMRKFKEIEHIDIITPEIIEQLNKTETDERFGDQTIPIYLILNKIDLCTNKRKLKTLINELEEISRFEKVFFTSAETGYGIKDIISSLEEEAYSRPWELNPQCKSELSEVEELEQLMRTYIYERFYKEVPYKIGIQVKGKFS